MNIFKYIGYALKTRQGIHHTDEFVSDISFGAIEAFFIGSFVILGIITLGLGFVAFYYANTVALVLAILFLLVLSLDIFIFIKVRNFFKRISKKAVDFSKEQYKRIVHKNDDYIIEVEYDEQ